MWPAPAREADDLDPVAMLRANWPTRSGGEPWPGDEPEARRPADGTPARGPAGCGWLDSVPVRAALTGLPPGAVGLIPAERSADVLPVAGWSVFDDLAYRYKDLGYGEVRNGLYLAAVLRSWEDRLGARLLALGPGARLQVLAGSAPQTLDAARPPSTARSATSAPIGPARRHVDRCGPTPDGDLDILVGLATPPAPATDPAGHAQPRCW